MAESVRTHSLAGGVPVSSGPLCGAGGGMMGVAVHRVCATTARYALTWCVRARRLALPGAALLLAGCEPLVGGDGGGGSVACPGGPDPLFVDQWHLENTGQTALDGSVAATPGVDLGVDGAWSAGYRGSGVGIAVLDDAVDIGHEDLRANVLSGRSVDYTDGGDDPSPEDGSGLFHGTAVAGISAARDDNGCGGRGVAPRAGVAGFNILSSQQGADTLDALEQDVAVSNNSWGPADSTGELRDLGLSSWQATIQGATEQNRNGLGTVFLWAAGNGYGCVDVQGDDTKNCEPVDDSNYDGAANYWRVLAVSAVNARGRPAVYSERGANVLVAGPGGRFCTDGELAVTTTFPDGFDRPDNWTRDYTNRPAYTRCFNGTSAAAPGVAGVAALVLEANPDLTWREVRWILATTARDDFQAADAEPLAPADDWATNGAGETVSHAFGHGLVDAAAAVQAAEAWSSADRFPALEGHSQGSSTGWTLSAGNSVTADMTISGSGIDTLEAVEVTLDGWSHDDWNRLDIELVHEDGSGNELSRSLLAEEHFCEVSAGSYSLTGCAALNSQSWTFSTTHHLGEAADGTWRLEITDNRSSGSGVEDGSLDSWTLTFHGH